MVLDCVRQQLRGEIMELKTHLDYLRAQHKEILGMALDLEVAFSLAHRKDIRTRPSGIARLRSHQDELPAIIEHCHSVHKVLESPFLSNLKAEDVNQLNEGLGDLERLVVEFQRELEFASVDRTSEVITAGNSLVEALRSHISLEETIVKKVEETNKPVDEALARYIQ